MTYVSVAYISKVERLQVPETVGMKKYQYQHYFTVRHSGIIHQVCKYWYYFAIKTSMNLR